MAKVGLITIGQSPREDVVSEMSPVLGPGLEVVERGALDLLSPRDIASLKPEAGDFPLVTRLRNGAPAVVGESRIVPFLQEQIDRLEDSGVDFTAFLCTDDFPGIFSRRLLLRPSRILFHMVRSLLGRGRLGLFVPLQSQRERAREKWGGSGLEVMIAIANPYGDSGGLDEELREMKKFRADLLVLDCIGYSLAVKSRIKEALGRPVLLPRTVLARAVREIAGE